MRYNCENRINTPPSPFSLKSEETSFCKRAMCPKLIFDIVLRIGIPDIIIPSRIDYGCAEVVSECCIIIGERVVCFPHELKSGLFLSGVRSPIVYLSFVKKMETLLKLKNSGANKAGGKNGLESLKESTKAQFDMVPSSSDSEE